MSEEIVFGEDSYDAAIADGSLTDETRARCTSLEALAKTQTFFAFAGAHGKPRARRPAAAAVSLTAAVFSLLCSRLGRAPRGLDRLGRDQGHGGNHVRGRWRRRSGDLRLLLRGQRRRGCGGRGRRSPRGRRDHRRDADLLRPGGLPLRGLDRLVRVQLPLRHRRGASWSHSVLLRGQ